MRRMCKIKELPEKTGGIISQYMGRKLYLEGKIPGVRLGNSIILVDLDGLEQWLQDQAQANVKQSELEQIAYGKIRRIN